ncbi:DegT/DnrJ/EryC1/StrS family aminotransferase [Planctomycetota bacterium]
MTLALHGGKAVRATYLPYARQDISASDRRAVDRILQSDFLTTGPAVPGFEQAFVNYVGCKSAIAFSNGTAALHAAIYLLKLEPGDEVITTPLTFAATANVVMYEGGVPRFADIDPDGNLCPQAVEDFITANYRRAGKYWRHHDSGGRLRAVAVVHYTGRVVDMKPFHRLGARYNLAVLEDASHALGAVYPGAKRPVGNSTASLAVTFSFHPVKIIAAGEGGMVAVRNRKLAGELAAFRHHGIVGANPANKLPVPGMEILGYNYRLSDIHCALGESQLKRIARFLHIRRGLVARYDKAFNGHDLLIPPRYREGMTESAWHIYVIQLKSSELAAGRNQVLAALRAENIGANIHYIPVYHHPYYAGLKRYHKGDCPQAEKFCACCITLPLFCRMSRRDVDDVVSAVNKVLAYYRC